MNNNIKHYVEEIWTELDYKEGFSETKHIFPITKREKYKTLPWVKQYRFFDLDINSKELNSSPFIYNKNYNPVYFMDDQHKMIKTEKIDIKIIYGIYSKKTNNKKEKILLIKNKEETNLNKQTNIKKFVKITIDGSSKIYEIPTNEIKTDDKNKSIIKKEEKIIPLNKKRVLTPFIKKHNVRIGIN